MGFPGAIAALLGAAILSTGQAGPVAGQYIEDRSARVYGCPCEWSNDWMSAGREAVLAWSIQSGEFQGQDLAGLRIVAALTAEFNVEERRAARRATLFLDAAAPAAQRRAGSAWVRSRYGEVLGRILAEHEAVIDFRIRPDAVSLQVGGILELAMRPARIPQDTETWASLLYDPLIPLVASNLGTTSHIRYSGPDLRVNWTREAQAITGYYGTFSAP